MGLEGFEDMSDEMAACFRQAADVIDQNTWVRGDKALDQFGHTVDPWHEDACKFCAAGALERVSWLEHGDLITASACIEFFHEGNGATITNYNDYSAPHGLYMSAKLRECARELEGVEEFVPEVTDEKR